MIRKIVPQILFILLFLTINSSAFSNQSNWQPAKEGNKIILIRHALAPGGGDPKGFKLDDCKTQRNLNKLESINLKKLEIYLKKTKLKLIRFYQVNGVDVKILQCMPLKTMRNFHH